MAEEALGLALLTYPARGLPLPKAKTRGRGMVPVAVAPDVAAKLAVLEAFGEAEITKVELARRLGKDEKEVRRIRGTRPSFRPSRRRCVCSASAWSSRWRRRPSRPCSA
jgi:antitoxin HicB